MTRRSQVQVLPPPPNEALVDRKISHGLRRVLWRPRPIGTFAVASHHQDAGDRDVLAESRCCLPVDPPRFLPGVSPGKGAGGNVRGVSAMSLEEAYRRYADELVRYATVLVSRSDAADVVADTFADLLRNPTGAWLAARDQRAFLFGAVANHARMHHRRTARHRDRAQRLAMASRRPAETETLIPDPPDDLVEAFDGLSVQQRAVTYLTYWHDYSVAQVAAALGVGDGTVRRQLARARERLRGAMT